MSDATNPQDTAQVGTAIVPATPEPAASPLTLVTSLEGFENATITPANMVIVQATTRDTEADPGHFKDMVTGQQFKTLQIVPLKVQVNPGPRVYFEKGSEFGSDPICRSNDGIRPAQNALTAQSEFCKDCPKASWANWKGGKGSPPECKENARILFLERESHLPYIMTAKGKSVAQVKGFFNAIIRHVQMAAAKGQKLSLYDFTAEISLDKQSDSRGVYYVLQFHAPGGQQGIVGRVRTVGEFGPIYHELVTSRKVLEQAKDDVIDAEVLPAGGAPLAANQIVDAEVVDSDIPF